MRASQTQWTHIRRINFRFDESLILCFAGRMHLNLGQMQVRRRSRHPTAYRSGVTDSTIAKMPLRIGSGSRDHASTNRARSGS